MSELHHLTVAELATALRNKQVSATETAQHFPVSYTHLTLPTKA